MHLDVSVLSFRYLSSCQQGVRGEGSRRVLVSDTSNGHPVPTSLDPPTSLDGVQDEPLRPRLAGTRPP